MTKNIISMWIVEPIQLEYILIKSVDNIGEDNLQLSHLLANRRVTSSGRTSPTETTSPARRPPSCRALPRSSP